MTRNKANDASSSTLKQLFRGGTGLAKMVDIDDNYLPVKEFVSHNEFEWLARCWTEVTGRESKQP